MSEVTTIGPSGAKISRVTVEFSDGIIKNLSGAEINRVASAVGWPSDKAAGGDMRKAAVSAVGDAESALRAAEQERDPRAKILLQKRANDAVRRLQRWSRSRTRFPSRRSRADGNPMALASAWVPMERRVSIPRASRCRSRPSVRHWPHLIAVPGDRGWWRLFQ